MDDLKKELVDAIKNNAGKPSKKQKNKYFDRGYYIGSGFFALFALIVLYLIPKPFTIYDGPYGKIHLPVAGSDTGKFVVVQAESRNIDTGQYVWLAVDHPELDLCWPKSPKIKCNTGFRATILEAGPKGSYNLSLYVLNETLHKQWRDWVDHEMFGGLPMPPDSRRLDSVKLFLN